MKQKFDFISEQNPELKHSLKMQKIKLTISKMVVSKLSDLQLIKIANILNEVEQ